MSGEPVIARIGAGIASVPAAAWDACAGPGDPFLSHAFLSALEESESVGPKTGWQPVPVIIDSGEQAGAVMPAYLKDHSLGEYVFDSGWADAWQRAGRSYYPKLQIAVPFTPVPGRRLLARDPKLAGALIAAAERITVSGDLSSAHATFIDPAEVPLFEAAGWLIRTDIQFHWFNSGFSSFDDFLASLSSRRRKTIAKERVSARGLEIRHLAGAEIEETHWDAFWDFYQDTGARKWGRPYLERSFFSMLGERLGDRVLLIMAFDAGVPIAGALNLVGSDALYGRYWGTLKDAPNLHFELCYYQAMDAAIARGLSRVEAGAQGGHKLMRGYRPVTTFSAHFIVDPDFRRAVAEFLAAERHMVEREAAGMEELLPFRKG